MRKRTFLDRKFSQGDSNSDLFRENWDRMFGNKSLERNAPSDVGVTGGETPDSGESPAVVTNQAPR